MKLTKKSLIWIVIGWILLSLFNYYYMNFFFLAFELLGLTITLFVISIFQILRLIEERNKMTRLRIQKAVVFSSLFLLTFFHSFTNRIIEKVDWTVFESKRNKIVKQVKERKLSPNVGWNGWVCELPFEFPVVSNGGNDIGVYRNKTNETLTVTFWVFRNYFDSPSTQFVYTDDLIEIERIEKKIKNNPSENWKLNDNWYRTYGE